MLNCLFGVIFKVNEGHYTPYNIGDGQRIAFVRIGDESLPATAEQMVRLVLKGTNKTFAPPLLMLPRFRGKNKGNQKG